MDKLQERLSLDDYFNYLIPGYIWAIYFLLLVYVIDSETYKSVLAYLEQLNFLKSTIIFAFIPFMLGVILSFMGSIIVGIDNNLIGKPYKYVLSRDKNRLLNILRFKSLGKELADKVEECIKETFDIENKSSSGYWLALYSLSSSEAPSSYSHIRRLFNLRNLYEGLIPSLLSVSIIGLFIIPNDAIIITAYIFVSIIILFGLWYRYHYIKNLIAKQVFRYFYIWRKFNRDQT
jgi:hypothetical protein